MEECLEKSFIIHDFMHIINVYFPLCTKILGHIMLILRHNYVYIMAYYALVNVGLLLTSIATVYIMHESVGAPNQVAISRKREIERQTDRQTDRYRQTERQIDRDRQIQRQKQTNRQMDKQRQADRYTVVSNLSFLAILIPFFL